MLLKAVRVLVKSRNEPNAYGSTKVAVRGLFRSRVSSCKVDERAIVEAVRELSGLREGVHISFERDCSL